MGEGLVVKTQLCQQVGYAGREEKHREVAHGSTLGSKPGSEPLLQHLPPSSSPFSLPPSAPAVSQSLLQPLGSSPRPLGMCPGSGAAAAGNTGDHLVSSCPRAPFCCWKCSYYFYCLSCVGARGWQNSSKDFQE